MYANIVWPEKLANVHLVCVFLIQIIDGYCIFRHLLANVPPRPKVGKLNLRSHFGSRYLQSASAIDSMFRTCFS